VELKWDRLRPAPDKYNFASGDWTVNYALQHQMKVRGTALVWHNALPSWFSSYANPQNAKALLVDHISTVVGRYAGKIHSWDVVNEVLFPPDKRGDLWRNSIWFRHMGPDYMETAFRAAAQADPKALLTWNENWLEEETEFGASKRIFLMKHLKELLSRGVPVQAIGIQSHLVGGHVVGGPHFRDFLHQLSDMGLKILITELDVQDQNLPNDIGARDQAVADAYYRYLDAVLEHKSVVAVLTWGLSDKYSWLAGAYPRADGAPVRTLPYDADMTPKPAYYAIAKAFDGAPSR
jgi:endo-1,4-beta-xylanase